MRALAKLGVIVLTAALLLFNPAILCALMTQPQPSAHSCCPKTPATQQDCAQPHCDGINATLTAATGTLPVTLDAVQLTGSVSPMLESPQPELLVNLEAPPPPSGPCLACSQLRL